MKRVAIALILIAAVPAIVSASSSLMNEVTGQNELVAESIPSTEGQLISSKSSRPQPHRAVDNSFEQPLGTKLSGDWL
jgi:hypothetical protein